MKAKKIEVECPVCKKIRLVTKWGHGEYCNSCRAKINNNSRHRKKIDVTGQKFSKLTALLIEKCRKRKTYWRCKCECGNETVVSLSNLRTGHVKSCGCISRKQQGKSNYRSYKSWNTMIDRCYNQKRLNYKRYGGRGITVCDRWHESYLNFLEDMGERPEGTSLDRIDVNGNYFKENCRWVTMKEQCRNKRNNLLITAFGKTQSSAEWSEEKNIGRSCLEWRIKNGWSPEESLTLEVSSLNRKYRKIS